MEVPKDYLLQLLQHEAILPEDATKIIGTGHTQDTLIVTVSFDNGAA